MKYKCPHCSETNECIDGYILYNDVQCSKCLKIFRLADADHRTGILGHMKGVFLRSIWAFPSERACTACPFCHTKFYIGMPDPDDGKIAIPDFCPGCTKKLPGPYNDSDDNVYFGKNSDPFPNKPTTQGFSVRSPFYKKSSRRMPTAAGVNVFVSNIKNSIKDTIKTCKDFYQSEKEKNGGRDLTDQQFKELLKRLAEH